LAIDKGWLERIFKAPRIISGPDDPWNPPITEKGTKRMARPARAMPSVHSSTPLSAEVMTSATRMAGRRSCCGPVKCLASVATRAAMTAHVGPSGPPMAKGSELRQAMIAPPTAPVMKVAAVP
jgi:hypothetical protein